MRVINSLVHVGCYQVCISTGLEVKNICKGGVKNADM